ncbi:hypothetical protein [Haloarchaeobius sp. TZWSO28]|uniref:hypothetical protein n=1 Tax=Haloarchaeobius sp. TZWSO28 TaxID=3446119 RepID=UPI003EBB0BEA
MMLNDHGPMEWLDLLVLGVKLFIPTLVGIALHIRLLLNPPDSINTVSFIFSLMGIQFTLGALLIAASSIYGDKDEYLADVFFMISSFLLISGGLYVFYLLFYLSDFNLAVLDFVIEILSLATMMFGTAAFYISITLLLSVMFSFTPTPFTNID